MMKRLTKKRKRLTVTQSELAEAIGVSVRTIKYWEAGQIEPNKAELQFIREYLENCRKTLHRKNRKLRMRSGEKVLTIKTEGEKCI